VRILCIISEKNHQKSSHFSFGGLLPQVLTKSLAYGGNVPADRSKPKHKQHAWEIFLKASV
jgi:hypothetical protein